MAMALPRPSALGTRPAYLDGMFREQPPTPGAHSSTSSISTNSTASSYDLRSAYYARPLGPPILEDQSDAASIRSKKSFLARRRFGLGSLLHRRTYPQQAEDDAVSTFEQRPSTSAGKPLPREHSPPLPQRSPPMLQQSLSMPSQAPPMPQHSPPIPQHSPPLPPMRSPVRPDTSTNVRRPSLPKLQTSFPPPQAVATYANRPLPAVPGQKKPSSRPRLERKPSSPSNAELNCQRCHYFFARNCHGYVMGGSSGDACEMCLGAGFFGAA